MQKLSICFVSFNYYPGQGSIAFYEFSRNVKEIGHNVCVIAAARSGEKNSEIVDGVKVIRIPVKTIRRRSLANLKFNLIASRFLSNYLKSDQIQIVHVFSYAFSSLIKLWTFPVSRKVKWIYDIRSGPLLDNIFFRLGNILLWIEASFFDKIFIIDENVKNDLFNIQKNIETVVIPLGVDLKRFTRARKPRGNRCLLSRYGIQGKDIVLVYVGSLNSKRRVKNLILAFLKASKKIKDLKLLIIGDGEDLPHLNILTKKLSVSDKVFFLGYIDYFRIPLFLSAADIAISYIPIIPAFDLQPPTKTIEYLACSLPVIATSTRGNQLFITHERNGLLSEDDPYSLSKEIIRLCLDTSLQNKLSINARSSIKEYGWKTIVNEKILPAYLEVLKD